MQHSSRSESKKIFEKTMSNCNNGFLRTVTMEVCSFYGQSHLLTSALSSAYVLSCLYCKQYGPRSNCSLGSSLIKVHIH